MPRFWESLLNGVTTSDKSMAFNRFLYRNAMHCTCLSHDMQTLRTDLRGWWRCQFPPHERALDRAAQLGELQGTLGRQNAEIASTRSGLI